jgi:hypothetical protein
MVSAAGVWYWVVVVVVLLSVVHRGVVRSMLVLVPVGFLYSVLDGFLLLDALL